MYKIKKIINYLIIKAKFLKIKGVKVKSFNVNKDIEVGEYVQIAPKVKISSNVKIGRATYISPYTIIDSNVIIGKFCSIAPHVFVAPGQHYSNFVTTHPILFDPIWRKKLKFIENEKYVKCIGKTNENTIIGNDVWIGLNAIIMRGIKIGDGAIIGAGAIVTKNVEPYSIVAGVPAKTIGYRFDKKEIEIMKNNKWWDLDNNEIETRINDMYDIDRYIKKYGQEKK